MNRSPVSRVAGVRIRTGHAILVSSVLAASLVAGCYAHVPVPFERVETGSDIRAYLTREGVSAAEEQLGRTLAAVDGTVLHRDAESLVLRIDLRPPDWQANSSAEALHQRLALQRNIVVALERRELDRGRTSALVAGTAAVLVGLLRYSLRVRDPGGETQPPRPNGEV